MSNPVTHAMYFFIINIFFCGNNFIRNTMFFIFVIIIVVELCSLAPPFYHNLSYIGRP